MNKEKLKALVDQSGKTIRRIQIEAGLNSGQLLSYQNKEKKAPKS